MGTNKPSNPLAFPKPSLKQSGEQSGDNDFDYQEAGHAGMNLRDYFAAKAITSVMVMCAKDVRNNEGGVRESLPEMFARKSYEIADAMLKEREKL